MLCKSDKPSIISISITVVVVVVVVLSNNMPYNADWSGGGPQLSGHRWGGVKGGGSHR